MFIKPKSEATPETQYGPESGVYVIGTGIGCESGEPTELEGQLSLDEVISPPDTQPEPSAEIQPAPPDAIGGEPEPQPEDVEKTQEFESIGRVKESDLQIKKKRLRGQKGPLRRVLAAALILLALCALAAGAAVYIAEPWIPPESDDYEGAIIETLPTESLSVGEVFPLNITLGANEKIASVDLDADLLRYNEDVSVTALGEYYKTTAVVKTKEIRVVQKGYERDIVLFGRDYTEEYFALRAKLRELMGVEKIEPPRTELRDLRVVTMDFEISGIPRSTETIGGEVEATKTFDVTIAGLDREAGQVAIVRSNNPDIAVVTEVDYDMSRCDFVITGVNKGQGTITATIGYWKQVSPEEYAEFLASPYAETAPELRENEIFVTVRDITYEVSVKAKKVQYYYYRGRWYAY